MIITPENNYKGLDDWLNGKKKVLLVCDGSIRFLDKFNKKLDSLTTPIVRFSDFQPNPQYDSVVKGVMVFKNESCDSIIAVGGGSSMDVAKCIKLYSNLDGDGAKGAWLNAEITPNDIPFLAMPTTAGTGSEATRYAVIYFEGVKQSVTSDSFIPEAVLMDPNALKSLPIYQKKSTMCDALCHAMESFWSVNSTEESKKYSREAIQLILANMDGYLVNDEMSNANMLIAANIAGKAINITQTTAGHAMCYKLTSLYGIAHGHASALCDKVLFPYMVANTDKCIDKRGEQYIKNTFLEIAEALHTDSAISAVKKFSQIIDNLELAVPRVKSESDIAVLKNSVNPERLKNNPIRLDTKTIESLYSEVLINEN